VRPSVVQVIESAETWSSSSRQTTEQEIGYGSGTYIRTATEGDGGYILTNNHVVQDGDTYKIVWLDGTEMPCTLVGTDDGTDIAILKFDQKAPSDAQPVTIGDSDLLQIGELAIVIGNPGAGDYVLYGTVTSGIISGLERMPGSALLYVELGNSYIGHISEMRETIEMDRARDLWMDYLLGYFDLQIQTAQTKLEHHLAEFHYSRVMNMKLDLKVSLAHAEETVEKLTSDHTARATEAFQHALELEPSNLLARSGLGHLADALGQPENSTAYYEDILAVDPHAEVGLMNLANAYVVQGHLEEAISLFQTILLYDPANDMGNYGLFKAYRGMKQPTVSQAAATVEHSIPTWDDLFKYSKEKSGN
jgi:hypothetical protein